ncbi:MAG: hypothetical protein FWD62_15515 [Betaproteobacteria bacterium]|nr:hypothetical protein [Betaproteobacteria bacterium]
METRLLIDVLFGAGLAAVGWLARELWSVIKELKEDVSGLRENLPKEYVLKADMENALVRIDTKLDKIFDRLEGKADKQGNHLPRRCEDI